MVQLADPAVLDAPSPRAASLGNVAPIEHSGLTRQQTIDRIITINFTATAVFLDRFEDSALNIYLEHLLAVQTPRGRGARWVRPGDSPAIMVREAHD